LRLALEILVLTIGTGAILSLLPRRPRRARVRGGAVTTRRPADLERFERLVTISATASAVHLRLRPVLREIAAARLGRRGISLDGSPGDARPILGEDLWELVRPDRPRPADPRGPGISLAQLTAFTDRLEDL
jgi:hypothetical protein